MDSLVIFNNYSSIEQRRGYDTFYTMSMATSTTTIGSCNVFIPIELKAKGQAVRKIVVSKRKVGIHYVEKRRHEELPSLSYPYRSYCVANECTLCFDGKYYLTIINIRRPVSFLDSTGSVPPRIKDLVNENEYLF